MSTPFLSRTLILWPLLCAMTPPAGQELDLAALMPVDDSVLAEQRGGLALEGLEIRLGADIRTYLDGALVLQTIVQWDETNGSTTQSVSGSLSPADAQTLANGVLSTGSIRMRVGEADVYLANQGQTAILHRTDGGLQNIVVNTASNTALTQTVDATLDIGGYDRLGDAAQQWQGLSQLMTAIDAGALSALPR